MAARDYASKRDFSKTREPRSGKGTKRKDGKPVFVIQKHDASTLHYDFRLEVDGTLKSWVVPKGPSTDPREKRLALPVEDHPIEYADFEGTIPQGEYGGGTVMVWDRGTWENVTDKKYGTVPAAKAIAQGHLLFRVNGEKLSGGYALQRTGKGDDARWLLIKMDDDEADARRNPVSTEPASVASGRMMDEIAAEEGEA